jgi:hypothetical protein
VQHKAHRLGSDVENRGMALARRMTAPVHSALD